MSIMGFNPAADLQQIRTQQTLAMQSAAGAAPATAAGATDPASAAVATGAQGVAAAGDASGAADAAAGAAGVQAPNTSKILMQSVLRGALSGASVTLGLKSFSGTLGKIGMVAKAGAFLSKLPVLGSVFTLMGRGGLAGFAITALVGAAVGAIFGAVSGMKKAKQAQADFAAAQAAAAQQAAQQAQQQASSQQPTPDAGNAAGKPATPGPVKVSRKKNGGHPHAKTWVIASHGSTKSTGGSFGHYTTVSGDTLAKLAERFHTTPAEIKKLNPGIGDSVPAGRKLKLRRQVIPGVQRWNA